MTSRTLLDRPLVDRLGDASAARGTDASSRRFDFRTPEEVIAAHVENVAQDPARRDELAALLSESLPLYEGRSTNEALRIRGYTLASFERTGLPPSALPYVLEELESGRSPYVVAAAARAVRGLAYPWVDLVPYLLRALENIRVRDDAVTFESYRPRWPLARCTTAATEILRTLAWLGPLAASAAESLDAILRDRANPISQETRLEIEKVVAAIRASEASDQNADCCSAWSFLATPAAADRRRRPPWHLTFEDQDGKPITFAEQFRGKPSVVSFFYTRCDNPNKCSASITKLGQLQQVLAARGFAGRVRIAAVTYDAAYDSPPLLKMYGRNRGMTFTADDRILRARVGFQELQRYFGLGVGYGPATVNQHRIELFVLDRRGRIAASFTRLQWSVETVSNEVVRVLADSEPWHRRLLRRFRRAHESNVPSPRSSSVQPRLRRPDGAFAASVMGRTVCGPLSALVLAVLPKCPLCWAAWLTAAGVGGLQHYILLPWLRPALIVIVAGNLALVCARSRLRTWRAAVAVVAVSFVGTVTVVTAALGLGPDHLIVFGTLMMIAGSLLNGLPLHNAARGAWSPSRRCIADAKTKPGEIASKLRRGRDALHHRAKCSVSEANAAKQPHISPLSGDFTRVLPERGVTHGIPDT